MDNIVLICSVLLGVSEALSLIPWIKANGIIQLIMNILKMLLGKKE
jgi:hypothetical protein